MATEAPTPFLTESYALGVSLDDFIDRGLHVGNVSAENALRLLPVLPDDFDTRVRRIIERKSTLQEESGPLAIPLRTVRDFHKNDRILMRLEGARSNWLLRTVVDVVEGETDYLKISTDADTVHCIVRPNYPALFTVTDHDTLLLSRHGTGSGQSFASFIVGLCHFDPHIDNDPVLISKVARRFGAVLRTSPRV